MMRAKLMLLGAAAAVALSSTAAVASVVVVRSLGPSSKAYPPGKTLPESASISLKGGDVVTVLGPGSAQTLRGPGNFPAKQMASSANAKRGRFGSLRTSEVVRNPSIWDLDVTQSGTMCVTTKNKLTMWRPDADTEAKVTIRASNGKAADLNFAEGKTQMSWPAAMPIANSSEYQIEWPSSGEKSSIKFVTVANTPGDLVGAAQVLIEHGCKNQLDLLVESASRGK